MKYIASKQINNEQKRLRIMNLLSIDITSKALKYAKQQLITATPIILDAGCGTGEDFAIIKKHFPYGQLEGIDISPKALEKAAKKNTASKLKQADILHYTAKNNYDLIFAKSVLMHINYSPRIIKIAAFLGVPGVKIIIRKLGERGVNKVIKNFLSSLKPGGAIILQEPDYTHMHCPFTEFGVFKECLIDMMQSFGINPYIGGELKKYLQKNGLKNIETFDIDLQIKPNSELWEITEMLYEVAAKPLQKKLQSRGVVDFPVILEKARKDPKNILVFKGKFAAIGIKTH